MWKFGNCLKWQWHNTCINVTDSTTNTINFTIAGNTITWLNVNLGIHSSAFHYPSLFLIPSPVVSLLPIEQLMYIQPHGTVHCLLATPIHYGRKESHPCLPGWWYEGSRVASSFMGNHGRRNMIFVFSSLISPFYLWFRYYCLFLLGDILCSYLYIHIHYCLRNQCSFVCSKPHPSKVVVRLRDFTLKKNPNSSEIKVKQ